MKAWIFPPYPELLPSVLKNEFPSLEVIVSKEAVPDAEIIIGNPAYDLLKANPNLKLLQLRSAGTANYPALLKENRALTLCCATGAYGHAVSEHMFSALLTIMKRLDGYKANQLNHTWTDLGPAGTIRGANVLVLGLGNIGGEFGKMCMALGAHVTGFRRIPTPSPECAHEVYSLDRLDEFLPYADVIGMALPETAETKDLFTRERFRLVKKGAYLVNAGRGSAIDEDALMEALESGQLAAASLDVTRKEPLPADHPLWNAKNLLITPHISGGDHLPDIAVSLIDITVSNIRALFEGRAFVSRVDPVTGYRER